MNKVLLVEDETELRDFLKGVFDENGFETLAVENGEKALTSIENFNPKLLVLDHNLPDMNGAQILQKVKAHPRFSKLPVIFLTAVSKEDSIISAFDMGADDYIEKPFSISILLRRMKAVLNRSEGRAHEKSVSLMKKGDLEVDFETYKVKISNQPLEMTLMEFNILKELIRADGRPLSREALIQRINGSTAVTERTIDVHICAIRKKLNTYGRTIETIRGIGYRLQL